MIGGDIRVQNQDWRIYDRRRYQGAESKWRSQLITSDV